MNRYRKYILLLGFFLLTNILLPFTGKAQPVDPGCDPLDPACPVDGGISLLIAAGIGMAAKKAYNIKKHESKKLY